MKLNPMKGFEGYMEAHYRAEKILRQEEGHGEVISVGLLILLAAMLRAFSELAATSLSNNPAIWLVLLLVQVEELAELVKAAASPVYHDAYALELGEGPCKMQLVLSNLMYSCGTILMQMLVSLLIQFHLRVVNDHGIRVLREGR